MSKLDLGGLDAILGLRLRRAHGAVQRHFGDHFSGLGLTQKQVSILWLVERNSEIAQTNLAAALDMDRATTMALVHGLEKRGLLARRAAGQDRRRVSLIATAEGLSALAAARAAISEHEAWLKGKFSRTELVALEEMLARIYS